jgi:hypothetical protein
MSYAQLKGDGLWDWTFPEEDGHLYTTAPWTGGFRWFRSANVVPLEQYRRRRSSHEDHDL